MDFLYDKRNSEPPGALVSLQGVPAMCVVTPGLFQERPGLWPAAISLFPCLLHYLGHQFPVALLLSEAAPLQRPSGWVPPGPKAP